MTMDDLGFHLMFLKRQIDSQKDACSDFASRAPSRLLGAWVEELHLFLVGWYSDLFSFDSSGMVETNMDRAHVNYCTLPGGKKKNKV